MTIANDNNLYYRKEKKYKNATIAKKFFKETCNRN